MTISTRDGLKDYCLRKLGWPVVTINIDDDQVDDRIDDALQFFQDYHYDASQKVYISHRVSTADVNNKYISLAQLSGVANTVASSNVVTGTGTQFASELIVGISQIQIGAETKNVASVLNNTTFYADSVYVTGVDGVPITSVNEADAIVGVTKIFPIASSASVNMFDLRYQLRLHDLYDFTAVSYVNYTLTQQHLRTLEMLFTGENPIRFNRHQHRLYVDCKWGSDLQPGDYCLIEAWKIVDPNSFVSVYDDRFLKRYSTALIKRQWGQNLLKFQGIKLPGDVMFNGQALYDAAETEITKLEDEIQLRFEEPPEFIMG